jgi:hypothetical protein
MKTIAFNKVKKPTNSDDWVRSAGALVQEQPTAAPAQPMKRLTIDVSVDLHTRAIAQFLLASAHRQRPVPDH